MSHSGNAPLAVSIKDLPAVHVAYVDCPVNVEQDQFSNEIRKCFQRVQAWVSERGYDPHALLTIGVTNVVNGQLLSYECCEQVPQEVKTGTDDIGIKELVGGRYAVVSIEKHPAIIGDSIRRFHQEYVPHNGIRIDGTRPTYEIYYEGTMEYCVPIL